MDNTGQFAWYGQQAALHHVVQGGAQQGASWHPASQQAAQPPHHQYFIQQQPMPQQAPGSGLHTPQPGQYFVIQNPDGTQVLAQSAPPQPQVVWVQQQQPQMFSLQPQQGGSPSFMQVAPPAGNLMTQAQMQVVHANTLSMASMPSSFGAHGGSIGSQMHLHSTTSMGSSVGHPAGTLSQQSAAGSAQRRGPPHGAPAQPLTHESEQPDPHVVHSIRPFLGPKTIGSILDTPSKLPLLDTLPPLAKKRPPPMQYPVRQL